MKNLLIVCLALAFGSTAPAARHMDIEYARVAGESLKLDVYVPEEWKK